jgi:hypothetical protein
MINKLKIEDAGLIVMPAGKFLVEQMKERKHTVTRQIPKEAAGQEGKEDPVMELEEVKQREPYYTQFYKIVSAPAEEKEYVVGDIILASSVAGSPFDLINKAKVVNKFEIMGKYIG